MPSATRARSWPGSTSRLGGGLPWHTPQPKEFVEKKPYLEIIDVTEAAGSTSGNGHAYFRSSPWVSSDLLTALAYDVDPAGRGLEKMDDEPVWTFPPDYIERLRKVLLELNPRLAGG